MVCPYCNTPAENGSAFCTACGAKLAEPTAKAVPTQSQKQAAPAPKTAGLAIASLVLSLVGIFCAGLVCGVLGIVFGCASFPKIRAQQLGGKNLATAGIVIGIVDVIGWLIFMLLYK